MSSEHFEAFVKEHHSMVYALACAYAGPDAAEDVCQETYLRAFQDLQSLKDPSRCKPWLYALTRNAAIDHLRKQRRQDRTVRQVEPPRSTGEVDMDTVTRVLDRLREDFRQIVLLRYVERLSYREIGEALGMAVGAVGEKLHRVRAALVDEYAKLQRES
jgi:RNA polymerase sigma-70 factor (ECF subfamily)